MLILPNRAHTHIMRKMHACVRARARRRLVNGRLLKRTVRQDCWSRVLSSRGQLIRKSSVDQINEVVHDIFVYTSPCLRFTFRCYFMCVINLICSCKATSGRPAYSPALCQIKTTLVKLLVYFWCQVKIWEGQAKDSMTITVLSFENHAF